MHAPTADFHQDKLGTESKQTGSRSKLNKNKTSSGNLSLFLLSESRKWGAHGTLGRLSRHRQPYTCAWNYKGKASAVSLFPQNQTITALPRGTYPVHKVSLKIYWIWAQLKKNTIVNILRTGVYFPCWHRARHSLFCIICFAHFISFALLGVWVWNSCLTMKLKVEWDDFLYICSILMHRYYLETNSEEVFALLLCIYVNITVPSFYFFFFLSTNILFPF